MHDDSARPSKAPNLPPGSAFHTLATTGQAMQLPLNNSSRYAVLSAVRLVRFAVRKTAAD